MQKSKACKSEIAGGGPSHLCLMGTTGLESGFKMATVVAELGLGRRRWKRRLSWLSSVTYLSAWRRRRSAGVHPPRSSSTPGTAGAVALRRSRLASMHCSSSENRTAQDPSNTSPPSLLPDKLSKHTYKQNGQDDSHSVYLK